MRVAVHRAVEDLLVEMAGDALTIPVVAFDQIYSFDTKELVKAIDRPEQMSAEDFEPASYDLLRRVMQLGDNAGDTDVM